MARRKPKTKAEFFERELKAWEELNALVTDLPDTAWTQPGAAGDWSLKDVWVHIAAWMKETRRVVPMLIRAEGVPSVDIQYFNREHYERDRNLLLDAARRRVERERKRLLAYLKMMPEESLLHNRRIYTWAAYATYKHYAQHVPDIVRFHRRIKRRKRGSGRSSD
jgi:uncharacterized damage-inducible protein DinB